MYYWKYHLCFHRHPGLLRRNLFNTCKDYKDLDRECLVFSVCMSRSPLLHTPIHTRIIVLYGRFSFQSTLWKGAFGKNGTSFDKTSMHTCIYTLESQQANTFNFSLVCTNVLWIIILWIYRLSQTAYWDIYTAQCVISAPLMYNGNDSQPHAI